MYRWGTDCSYGFPIAGPPHWIYGVDNVRNTYDLPLIGHVVFTHQIGGAPQARSSIAEWHYIPKLVLPF